MHVHDPASSVLEVGLWDGGEEGAIPLAAMPTMFKGGKQLVATARVPVSQVGCAKMKKIKEY